MVRPLLRQRGRYTATAYTQHHHPPTCHYLKTTKSSTPLQQTSLENEKGNKTEKLIRKTNKGQWNKMINKAQKGGLGPLFWPRELSAKPLPPNKDGGSAGVGIICQLLKMEAQTRGHKTFPGSNTPPKICLLYTSPSPRD